MIEWRLMMFCKIPLCLDVFIGNPLNFNLLFIAFFELIDWQLKRKDQIGKFLTAFHRAGQSSNAKHNMMIPDSHLGNRSMSLCGPFRPKTFPRLIVLQMLFVVLLLNVGMLLWNTFIDTVLVYYYVLYDRVSIYVGRSTHYLFLESWTSNTSTW